MIDTMQGRRSLYFILMIVSLCGLLLSNPIHAAAPQKVSLELKIDGAIGPATVDYVKEALSKAHQLDAEVVVLRLDTPGGLSKSMRSIVKAIIGSAVPVVTYVSPSGARAASAGTYILYGSHIAAMSPGTHLGAATPVSISFPGIGSDKKKEKNEDKEKAKDKSKTTTPKTAMERKILNDSIAYIRGLAELRGRNVEWAEKAVREAVSITDKEALKINVIDVVAPNMTALFKAIDGRVVTLQSGKKTLHTANLIIHKYEPNWRIKFLAVITNPSVAYILLMIAIWGIFFEFANPGFVVPGVVGGICLLIALYAFQLLPINYAGLGLILFGVALLVGEAFIPSFGVLGLGGVVAFVFGSIMLMNTGVPGFAIGYPVIITVSAVTAAFFLLVIQLAIRSHRQPVVSGSEEMIGLVGKVIVGRQGQRCIKVHSERWNVKPYKKASVK